MAASILRAKAVQKPFQLFHYYFLLEKRPGSTLADLSFETDVKISIQKFKNHTWTAKEVFHYGFLSSVILFTFVISPLALVVKTPILLAFITCFLIPLTSQFFVHALPILTWVALFFSASKIPDSWKPPISVKFLPAVETILYGDNLSNVLATINTSVMDVIAWLPYGIIHFSSPFVVAAFIFIFGPPTSLRSFGFAFGYMNLLGVMTQILFPAAPPWYKNLHGLDPADYSMSGLPGGLARIDELLGFDMYSTAFSNSPVVFGAFPSLHSGFACMDVFFLCWLFPKYRTLWWAYACWLWWSTMYLTHHYFVDLTCGAMLAMCVFTYTKYNHLPVIEEDKFCRWSYVSVKKINVAQTDPLNGFSFAADAESNIENTSPYFYNQPVSSLTNSTTDFEMTTVPRSRNASRSYVGGLNQDPSLLETNSMIGLMGRSASSLNLPVANELDEMVPTIEETETDNSTTNSMFENDMERDDEHLQISSTASSTLLDELATNVQLSKKAFGKSR